MQRSARLVPNEGAALRASFFWRTRSLAEELCVPTGRSASSRYSSAVTAFPPISSFSEKSRSTCAAAAPVPVRM